MAYKIAGIDVRKRMLAVMVADVEVVGEFAFRPAPVWQHARRAAGSRLRDRPTRSAAPA
jgi:hypothetical protein